MSQENLTPKTDEERIAWLENALEEQGKKIMSKEELKKVVRDVVQETMKEILFTTGKGTKAVIITLAVVIGSLAVIGGGIKWILGFIGYTYIVK